MLAQVLFGSSAARGQGAERGRQLGGFERRQLGGGRPEQHLGQHLVLGQGRGRAEGDLRLGRRALDADHRGQRRVLPGGGQVEPDGRGVGGQAHRPAVVELEAFAGEVVVAAHHPRLARQDRLGRGAGHPRVHRHVDVQPPPLDQDALGRLERDVQIDDAIGLGGDGRRRRQLVFQAERPVLLDHVHDRDVGPGAGGGVHLAAGDLQRAGQLGLAVGGAGQGDQARGVGLGGVVVDQAEAGQVQDQVAAAAAREAHLARAAHPALARVRPREAVDGDGVGVERRAQRHAA